MDGEHFVEIALTPARPPEGQPDQAFRTVTSVVAIPCGSVAVLPSGPGRGQKAIAEPLQQVAPAQMSVPISITRPVALLGAWQELMQFRRSARHPLNQLLFLESMAAHFVRGMRPGAT